MKKLFVIILGVLFFSCSTNSDSPKEESLAKGGKHYGGTIYLTENDAVKSLFPLHLSDHVSTRISSQIYEGLFKLNPKTLEVEKCLLKDYKVDSTHTLYTFTLKDSVYFHNNACFNGGKGRKLTSDDIIYCFSNICKYSADNHSFSIFYNLIEGANEYYQLSKKGNILPKVSGITKINNFTFTIKLKHPSTLFTSILSSHQTYIYPKEYILYSLENDISQEVGTGPFKLDSKNDQKIHLEKNTSYHMNDEFGNQLPFLDHVKYSFIEEKHVELDSFINLNTDLIYRLPADLLIDLHLHTDSTSFNYLVTDTPEMAIDYIGFNVSSKPYSSINLRKAIAYALNKKDILEQALDGEADLPGKYGITPPIFNKTLNYPVKSIKSPKYSEDSAKYYLELSQVFSEGEPKNLTLHYNVEGHRNDEVVNVISRELKRILGIDLLIKPHNQIEYNEAMESGKAGFFLSSWIYEYPHPQEHLSTFFTSVNAKKPNAISIDNIFGYSNSTFDYHYNVAFSTENDSIALSNYAQAEKILMSDLAIIPLWYDEGYIAEQTYIKDFHKNSLQYRDLRYTFIQPHNVLYPKHK